MILSKSNVVHYLVEQCLVPLDSMVDGDLMVADAARRNRNFKVIRRKGQGYFVKQIQTWDPQTVAALGTEAACYRLARSAPDCAARRALRRHRAEHRLVRRARRLIGRTRHVR